MKLLITSSLLFSLCACVAQRNTPPQSITLSCHDYSWQEVENLVGPYLDPDLFVALVMQAQSANFKTSIAAQQAMDDSLPLRIRQILTALINADC